MDTVYVDYLIVRPKSFPDLQYLVKYIGSGWQIIHMDYVVPIIYESMDKALNACNHHNQSGIWLFADQ